MALYTLVIGTAVGDIAGESEKMEYRNSGVGRLFIHDTSHTNIHTFTLWR
jgi:hypothetical protein